MLVTARSRIDRWLGELLANGAQVESSSIALVHAAVDQSQRTVKTWKLGEAVENIEALVGEIDETAEEDAEALGGRQRYVLRAQVKGKEVGSLTLRYEYQGEDGGPSVDSEPATPAGTIAVLQRHAEGAMRMMVQSFAGVIESYKEQVNAQKALIGEFQKQAAENFRLQEELASRKLERELLVQERQTELQLSTAREVSKIEKDELIWKQGLQQVFELAPLVVNYLTKGQAGLSPEEFAQAKRRADEERMFAEADDARIADWQRSLAPEQFAALMERLRAFRAARVDGRPDGSAQPATTGDRAVAAGAERLFSALGARVAALQALASAFFARTALEGLCARDRKIVEQIARDVSTATSAVDPGMAPDAGAMWSAILDTETAVLMPVVQAIRDRVAWSDVDAPVKVGLMRLVRRTVSAAGGPDGMGAP